MLWNLNRGNLSSLRAHLTGLHAIQRCIIAAVAAVLLWTSGAAAQGAGDALPKPITTGELVRYMQRLELSDQQQLAVTAMHDEYKRSYQTLYENELRDFLDEMRSMSGFNIPSRDELQDIVRGLRTMEGRIRSLDARLFNQMQSILTEDQLTRLPRVRLARKRTTYNQQQMLQMWTMGSPISDISAIIVDLDLPESELNKIDPLVMRYENNVTSRMARLHDSAGSLWLDMFDAIEDAGVDLDAMRNMDEESVDPEQMQKLMEVMQQIFMDLTEKGRAEVASIRQLNRETVQSFKGLIDDSTYRMVRNAYYSRSYPQIATMSHSIPLGVDYLVELRDITDAQRQAAADAIGRAHMAIDNLIEQAVDKTDRFRASFNMMDFDQDAYQKHQKDLQEIQTQARDAGNTLQTQLVEILSAEQFQQLQTHTAEMFARSRGENLPSATEVQQEQTAQQAAQAEQYVYIENSPDQYLPARINNPDLNTYYKLINAGEDQKAVIGELYDSYTEKMKTVRENEVQQVVDAQASIWSMYSVDDELKDFDAVKKTINEVSERRAVAMKAIAEADRTFFDEVELLLTEPAQLAGLNRARQLRARQRLLTQGLMQGSYAWGNSSREAQVDVVEFLTRQQMGEKSVAAIDPILDEYEQNVLPLLEQYHQRAVAFQKQQDLWSIRWQELQNDEGSGAARATLMNEYQETLGAAQRHLNDARVKVAEVNRDAFQKVIEAANDADTLAMRRSYNQLAYPTIYNDGSAVMPYIERALDLETLNADQRSRLIDLQAEYSPAYDSACEKMLELTRDAPAPNWTGDNDDWQKYQEYQDAMQHLRFERQELNSRALLQLRQALTDEQIEALGNLPEVAAKSESQTVYW